MDDMIGSEALVWAIGLVGGFPVLLVATNELRLRLRRAQSPLLAPVSQTRAIVLPALASLLLLVKVVGLGPETFSVRLLETFVWLIIVHTALSFLNALVFARAHQDSWQSRVPGLLIDLTRVILVLLCAAVILSTVWGQDLRQLVTALGVGSIVIGLALQEPLGNLFSGIFLMIERPLNVGDWLVVGTTNGRVVATNWRAIHLQTKSRDLVVVPNSVLAKQSFVNQSRAGGVQRRTVSFGFSGDDPPNHVKRILIDTALRIEGVLREPPPRADFVDLANGLGNYEVKLYIGDPGDASDVVEAFRTLVWYAARRHGLKRPMPTQTSIVVRQSDLDAAQREPLPPEVVNVFPRFALRNGHITGKPVSASEVKYYGRSEHVIMEGHRSPGLHLILKGQAVMATSDHAGRPVEVARLGRGEFFGEQSLVSSAVSDVTVTAAQDLELLIFGSDSLKALLDQTPHLTREISQVMEARRKKIADLRLVDGGVL